MKPRKADSTKTAERRTEERKRRFRILKLEERIAPHRNHAPGQSRCDYYGCPGRRLGN